MKISAHEKSKLTGVLTSWLGSAPGAGFDTESLRGKGAMINIVNKVSGKGRTYADITSVTPVMAGMEAQVPQPSQFNIPGGASAPAPQTTTQVTVEQPQAVAPAPAPTPLHSLHRHKCFPLHRPRRCSEERLPHPHHDMAGGRFFVSSVTRLYPKQLLIMIHYFLNPSLLLIVGVLAVVADMFFQL